MIEAIKGVLRRWAGPPAMVIGPGILPDNDELAKRVSQRLRSTRTSVAMKDPDGFMRAILESEIQIDVDMAVARERFAVQEAVHALPPRQRVLLLDRLNHGLTYRQLAKKHGLTDRIALRDLTRAYATLRMTLIRTKDERGLTVDNPGAVQEPAATGDATLWPAAPVVGQPGAVHPSWPTDRGFSVLFANQQPDADGDEGGRPEHPAPEGLCHVP